MSGNSTINVEIQEIPESWMNLRNRKRAIYDFWETFMDFCVTYPITALFYYALAGSKSGVYGLYLLLLSLFYLAADRNIIVKNYIYVLCQIPLFIAAYYFSGSLEMRVVVFSYLIIACSVSTHKRSRILSIYRSLSGLMLCQILLLFQYVIAVGAGYTFIQWIILYHTIIYCMSMLIYLHVSRTEKLMEWEMNLSKRDSNRLKSSSKKIIVSLSIPFIIACITALYEEFKGFRETYLLYLIGLLSRLFKGSPLPPKPADTNKVLGMGDLIGKLSRSGGAGKESNFIKVLGSIGRYLIYFLLFLAGAVLLKIVFDILYGYLSGRKGIHIDKKKSIFNSDEITENIAEKLNTLKMKAILSFRTTHSRRIRKIYKNLVERIEGSSKVIQKSSTPGMIEKDVKETTGVDISSATAIYEKARYGRGDCTEEDVKKIKSFKPGDIE